MQGFYIASSASVVGAALVFVTLRFVFSQRLRQWSSYNEKWQALEAVVVSRLRHSDASHPFSSFQRAKGLPLIILIRISPFPPCVYSNSLFAVSQMHRRLSFTDALTVYWSCRIMAICHCDLVYLPQAHPPCLYWLSDCRPFWWWPARTYGHSYYNYILFVNLSLNNDLETKIINGLLIAGGIILAIFTSWSVF